MPHATTAPGPRAPRRRAVLAACLAAPLAALVLESCSRASQADPAGLAAAALRRRAARDSADLLAKYDTVIAAQPSLGERLRPLRDQVAEHLAAFGGTTPRPSASGSPRGASTGADAALAALADAERRVADARTAALPGAPSEVARLLASAAAAGACHVLLLQGGA